MTKELMISNRRVLLDDEDYGVVSTLRWRLQSNRSSGSVRFYVRSSRQSEGRSETVLMHRIIIEARPDQVVDHINGDGLDNRRDNLRVCTQAQNMANRRPRLNASGYKGVTKCGQKWRAMITIDGTVHSLGTYSDKLTAARIYDAAAVKAFGSFALINFPGDENPEFQRGISMLMNSFARQQAQRGGE